MLAKKTRVKFYFEPAFGVFIATVLAVIGAKTDNKNLEIASIISGGIIALIFIIRNGEKQLFAELKQKVKGGILDLKVPFTWEISLVYPYLETKYLYNRFKDDLYIIKCLAEINFIYKTEYEITELIRKNVPDICILNSNNEVLAIIRFTNVNNFDYCSSNNQMDLTPYLYDTNGIFLGIIREYDYVVDTKGVFKGRLITVLNHFYIEPYIRKGYTANFKPMPNIIFTPKEIENFKIYLPDEMTLLSIPEYKPQIVLDSI